eukprot:g10703.t1.2.5e17418b g10703  g10703.t1 contig4:2377148-2378143(-)
MPVKRDDVLVSQCLPWSAQLTKRLTASNKAHQIQQQQHGTNLHPPLLTLSPASTSAFSVPNDGAISRRDSLAKTASLIGGAVATSAGVSLASPAWAEVTDETPRVSTRMGGLLEKYQDSRGWQILAPSGWNKFDGEVGAYDIKWQDLVDPTGRYHLLLSTMFHVLVVVYDTKTQYFYYCDCFCCADNIKLSSTPVKSTTVSIDALGPVADVGAKLAASRSAKLIDATERQTEGVLFMHLTLPWMTERINFCNFV